MSAQLNLYARTEAHSSVITKLHREESKTFFNTSASLFSCNYDSPLLDNLNKAFWHCSSEADRAARPRPLEGRKKPQNKKYLFAPVQTIFPELKMRAVVRGSLILMITAANLCKFKGGHHCPAKGFNWYCIFCSFFQEWSLSKINTVCICFVSLCLPLWNYFHTLPPHPGPGGLKLQSQDYCFFPYILFSSLESLLESPLFPVKFYSLGHFR